MRWASTRAPTAAEPADSSGSAATPASEEGPQLASRDYHPPGAEEPAARWTCMVTVDPSIPRTWR